MVSNLPELTLDLSPPAASPFIPDFLCCFPVAEKWDSDDLSKLNDFIHSLQNELNKVEAFKRELPLSVFLLNDVISKLKEEARKFTERRKEGKFDESAGAKLGNEKKSWMSSAQLWSPRNEGDDSEDDDVPGLSLVPPGLDTPAPVESGSTRSPTGAVFPGAVIYSTVDQTGKPQTKPPYHQTARKQRRCWSPDLHRRFVDALEKLGGPQVATPKQIRELMQVDGLTNDEVKSHLQKYRLHVRKLSSVGGSIPSSNDASTSADQVKLGYSKGDLLHTSSPEGPLHLARSGKCNSTSMEDDEDEEKSDGHSWKVQHHM